MFDEYESSYIDFNTSFLHDDNFGISCNEPCNLSFNEEINTKDNTLSTSLTDNHSSTDKQNSDISNIVTVPGFYNPKYKPIVDNGKEYKYEDNPALYRKIRK